MYCKMKELYNEICGPIGRKKGFINLEFTKGVTSNYEVHTFIFKLLQKQKEKPLQEKHVLILFFFAHN